MKIIPYGHQWIDQSDINAVIKVLKSDWITQGPKVAEFEEKVAKFCQTKYAVAVSSGTAALHAACFAAGIEQHSAVITSPLTFLATANSIVYQGGVPVFADIDPATLNISPEQIIRKINRKVKAIIAVHFAGLPCAMHEIKKIASKHSILVIEDAAHALGAEYQGKKIGALGDMAIFSFHPVKAITTGEGGMVLTQSKKLYERLLLFRNHGIARSARLVKDRGAWFYKMYEPGYNYRLTDFQCALGVSQLRRLSSFIKRRNEIADIYHDLFKSLSDYIDIPPRPLGDVKHAWHLYTIQLKLESLKIGRKEVFNLLRKQGIGVQVHYIPVHLQPFYKNRFGYKHGDFPNSERFYVRAISLPIFPKMQDRDIYTVASVVKQIILSHTK